MQKVLFDISMSLDGLITEPNEGARHPLGEDPGRLHDWMFDRRTEADAEVLDECHAGTGAVVMGQHRFMTEPIRRSSTNRRSRTMTSTVRAATNLRFRTTYEN